MALDCPFIIRGCIARFTELDSEGAIVNGAAVATVGDLVTATWTPEIAAGELRERRNACGEICASAQEDDQIRFYNFEMELCNAVPELYELLVGAALLGSGTGWQAPATNTPLSVQVSIEVWAEAVDDQNQPDPTLPYWHWLFPRVRLVLGPRAFSPDFMQHTFTGRAFENANFNGTNLPAPAWSLADNRAFQVNQEATAPTPSATCEVTTVTIT